MMNVSARLTRRKWNSKKEVDGDGRNSTRNISGISFLCVGSCFDRSRYYTDIFPGDKKQSETGEFDLFH
jgi:hypothetical protein